MSAHTWDTEPVRNVTYTPPPAYDQPWVIRMCCGWETTDDKVHYGYGERARTALAEIS